MRNFVLALVIILGTVAASGLSCGGSPGTGTLALSLSDAPIDAANVTGV